MLNNIVDRTNLAAVFAVTPNNPLYPLSELFHNPYFTTESTMTYEGGM